MSSYGASQREYHEKYDVLNDTIRPLTDDIPMADRGDPWDSRASYEPDEAHGRGHAREDSQASTIVGVPPQKEGHARYDSYPSRGPESEYTDRRPRPGGY